MVTMAVQVELLLQLSVTVKMTVLAPKFVQLNDVLLKLKATLLQLSLLPLFTAAALVVMVPVLLKFKLIFLQRATGFTVSFMKIVRDTAASILPQLSLPVHVSKTWPLQLPETIVVKVEGFEVPLMRQLPPSPLLKERVLGIGNVFSQ